MSAIVSSATAIAKALKGLPKDQKLSTLSQAAALARSEPLANVTKALSKLSAEDAAIVVDFATKAAEREEDPVKSEVPADASAAPTPA